MDEHYLHDASYFSENESDYDSESSPPPCIGRNKYNKQALKELVSSNRPEYKKQLQSIIIESIQENDIDVLEFLINKECNVLDVVLPDKNQTASHIAYYSKNHFILHVLTELIPDDHFTMADCHGLTFLHIGCSINDNKMIQRCLENNVDINGSIKYDPNNNRDGFTALHFAYSASIEIVELLLRNGADMTAKDDLGRQPIHVFCDHFNKYDLYTDSVDDKNNAYYSKMFGLLLDEDNINAKDKNGNTPLLSLFPDKYDYDDSFSFFPLRETILKLKILLERGADVNMTNDRGENILHRAIRILSSTICSTDDKYFDESLHVKLIDIILSSDQIIDVNSKNMLMETLLQLAVSLASAPIVKLLLNHNADFNCLNLSQNGQFCFIYPNNIPTLQVVQNIIRIVHIIMDKGFTLTSEDNLIIMKFLVHDFENCECLELLHSDWKKLVGFASASHLQYVIKKLVNGKSKENPFYIEGTLRAVKNLLSLKKLAGFFIDQETIDFVDTLEIKFEFDELEWPDIEAEISLMKSTSLKDNVKLHEVLFKNSWKVNNYINNRTFFELELRDKFPNFQTIIQGHVTKCLVRKYVETSALDYMETLICPSFPILCSKLIFDYLSTEDILHACLATTSHT